MTVATDIRSAIGPHRRLYLAIDGLEPYLFQGGDIALPSSWSRSTKKCLEAPRELSMGLDLAEMEVTLSAMNFVLNDVADTDGNSFFGKLFAPGRWDDNPHARVQMGGSYNTYINATDVELDVLDVSNMTNAATNGYLGQETINWATTYQTGPGLGLLQTVSRGLYPCVNVEQSWAQTYERPPKAAQGFQYSVGEVPFTFMGRRVALYITTYDTGDQDWRPESESQLLWVGRISEEINQQGSTRKWTLGCESIMAELKNKILVSQPTDYINGINLEGSVGRTFSLTEYVSGAWTSHATITVPAAKYRHDTLAKQLSQSSALWTWEHNTGTSLQKTLWIDVKLVEGSYVMTVSTTAADVTIRIHSGNATRPVHSLHALGFPLITDMRDITAVGKKNIAYIVEFTGKTYFDDYHPLHHDCNGKKLYLYRTDAFWSDQGDDPSTTQAAGLVKDAVLDPLLKKDTEGAYLFRYSTITGSPTWRLNLIDDPWYKDYSRAAYVGKKHGSENVQCKQVYIPKWMEESTFVKRGPFELLLYPLLSTGTSGYNHATYDKCPLPLSIGMQSELVDVDSFLNADKAIMGSQIAQRYCYIIDKSISFLDLLKRECKLFSYAPVWRKGKITLRPILKGSEEESWTVTLDESTRAYKNDFPGVTMATSTVLNQWRIKIDYDPVAGKYGPPITINDVDSILGMKQTKRVDIEHPGIVLNSPIVSNIESVLALELQGKLTRYPLPLVSVSLAPTFADRVFVGDVVRYISTTTQDPKGSGTRSVTLFATVIDVAWDYLTHTGSCKLALHYLDIAYPWAPAALVDKSASGGGYDSTSNSLILKAHTYGMSTTDPHDGEALAPEDGFRVSIIQRGGSDPTSVQSWGPLDVDTYTSANRALHLNEALAGFQTTRSYIVTFADYPDASSGQSNGDHATWQANVNSMKLDGSDKAHRYG